ALPGGVFNRPALERQLEALGVRYRLRHYSWELVPAEVQGNYGPPIDELEPLLQVAGVRPGLRYQPHIPIATSPRSRGLSPEVSIGSLEGLGLGGNYRDKDYWMPDDRWESGGRVAAGMRQYLDT